MIKLLEVIKIKLNIRKVCNDVLKGTRSDLEPNDTEGNIIFRMLFVQVVHGDSHTCIAVVLR